MPIGGAWIFPRPNTAISAAFKTPKILPENNKGARRRLVSIAVKTTLFGLYKTIG
jgi:hypothetical protein